MKPLLHISSAIIFSISVLFSLNALAAEKTAEVYFLTPHDGAIVESPVTIKFGLKGMGVAPAGINSDNTGHHHLLIDLDTLPDLSKPLASNDNIKHFGGGQTETMLALSPGTHTLQLVLGNYMHKPHSTPVLSKKITITVK